MFSAIQKISVWMGILLPPLILAGYLTCGGYLLDKNYNMDNPCLAIVWEYVLTSLIFTLLSALTTQSRKITENTRCIVLISLIYIGLAIWGGIKLADVDCNSQRGNYLFKFGFITFILQITISLTLTLIWCADTIRDAVDDIGNDGYNQI